MTDAFNTSDTTRDRTFDLTSQLDSALGAIELIESYSIALKHFLEKQKSKGFEDLPQNLRVMQALWSSVETETITLEKALMDAGKFEVSQI